MENIRIQGNDFLTYMCRHYQAEKKGGNLMIKNNKFQEGYSFCQKPLFPSFSQLPSENLFKKDITSSKEPKNYFKTIQKSVKS